MSVILQVTIRGRVQGVGYRAFVEDTALPRDLEGWVRNRRDGTVEAVFSGPEDVVAAMLEACWRGPPAAHVDAVEAVEGTAQQLALRRPGERFSVLSTAR
jgi:acylphosphatase